MVNTAFASNLQPRVINWKANAVFTIFALDFPLVCTFLHHIAPSKFVKIQFFVHGIWDNRQMV